METTTLDVYNEYGNLGRLSDHHENWSYLKLKEVLHGYKSSGGIQKTLNARHSLNLP